MKAEKIVILRSFALVAILCMLCCSENATKAEGLTNENLPQVLERLFQERPDLVLDVLRNNSESVLEIAQQGSNLRRKRTLEAQWKEDLNIPKNVKILGRPVLGNENAKVRIVAFTDFTCHYCQQASNTVAAILEEYGKDVNMVFKSMPLDEKGPGALAATYFLAVAQQNEKKAWEFYKKLFANRDTLIADGEKYLKKTAEGLGIDMKRLSRDIHNKKITELITEDLKDAQDLGIEGTPYFLVNRLVIRGALPLDLFKGAVDIALKNSLKK
ncbi:MAG: thioredoxin domain-containing protein [Desulfovibrio sp.]|nr:thioredoxin domain-containing protein [Desulfovibrio sp.]